MLYHLYCYSNYLNAYLALDNKLKLRGNGNTAEDVNWLIAIKLDFCKKIMDVTQNDDGTCSVDFKDNMFLLNYCMPLFVKAMWDNVPPEMYEYTGSPDSVTLYAEAEFTRWPQYTQFMKDQVRRYLVSLAASMLRYLPLLQQYYEEYLNNTISEGC